MVDTNGVVNWNFLQCFLGGYLIKKGGRGKGEIDFKGKIKLITFFPEEKKIIFYLTPIGVKKVNLIIIEYKGEDELLFYYSGRGEWRLRLCPDPCNIILKLPPPPKK